MNGSSIGDICTFCDDEQISSYVDCLMLQDDLYSIFDWSRRNNMKLHEQKFELLNHLHKCSNSCSEFPFYSETLFYKVSSDIILHPVSDVQDLGVMVSSDLSWSKHIGSVVSKARSTL